MGEFTDIKEVKHNYMARECLASGSHTFSCFFLQNITSVLKLRDRFWR